MEPEIDNFATYFFGILVVFGHDFVPKNSCDDFFLRRAHCGRVGPWFQSYFGLDYICKTSSPLVPGIFIADVFDDLGMDQFSMSTHVISISPICRELTELRGELDHLAHCGNHTVFNKVLVTDDCLRDAFCEILGSAVLGDQIMCNEATVILETHLGGPQILWGGSDVVKKTREVVHLFLMRAMRSSTSGEYLHWGK